MYPSIGNQYISICFFNPKENSNLRSYIEKKYKLFVYHNNLKVINYISVPNEALFSITLLLLFHQIS